MAKRIENECAFCAEEIIEGEEVVGKDWKVYCSERCAKAGEKMSLEEWQKVMESGEGGTRGQGDRGTRGQEISFFLSPCPPCLLVPHSQFLIHHSLVFLRGI
ncbi:MAG TPA: hypothetical protein VE715_19785 [Blastocatellia bacterium]|nr:hypothetical protein [Blastocatellia bacterium]